MRDHWDNIKHANLCIVGIQEGKENLLEKFVSGNFPNLKKETYLCRKHRVPKMMNPNRPTPRHIIIKMTKVKERILKSARERVKYKGSPINLPIYFSTEKF